MKTGQDDGDGHPVFCKVLQLRNPSVEYAESVAYHVAFLEVEYHHSQQLKRGIASSVSGNGCITWSPLVLLIASGTRPLACAQNGQKEMLLVYNTAVRENTAVKFVALNATNITQVMSGTIAADSLVSADVPTPGTAHYIPGTSSAYDPTTNTTAVPFLNADSGCVAILKHGENGQWTTMPSPGISNAQHPAICTFDGKFMLTWHGKGHLIPGRGYAVFAGGEWKGRRDNLTSMRESYQSSGAGFSTMQCGLPALAAGSNRRWVVSGLAYWYWDSRRNDFVEGPMITTSGANGRIVFNNNGMLLGCVHEGDGDQWRDKEGGGWIFQPNEVKFTPLLRPLCVEALESRWTPDCVV
jgi:hypothetical protein